ncbi:MAG: [Fe-Fe] hydrogenase large subunit C-terminal domain-containing protein, partial [Bacillota bacterium]|nr:[Fe-Fe] hydrogenase large subunit C-terminal domain-containing protein [Bacillota bacterium]
VEPDGITVNSELCIGCGECIRACAEKGHFARYGVDDFAEFQQDLVTGVPLGVLVAPAAAVNYHPWFPQLLTALRRLGVRYIFDVSFGAEITTYLYVKALEAGVKTPIIAQPCPAVVSYIETYHNDLVPYLAPTHSPALDAAIWLKNQPQFRELKLAFLGPCLAKRREFHDSNTGGAVAYNVTFKSFTSYLEQQGIQLEELEPSGFDTPEAERAVGYSQPGGLTETFKRFGIKVRKADLPRVEGPREIYGKYLPELNEDIRRGQVPILVDILNCAQGCNGGPAVSHNFSQYKIDSIIDERKEAQIEKHQTMTEGDPREVFQEFYQGIKANESMYFRLYSDKSSSRYLRYPSPEEEENIWKLMNKFTPAERGINCASCGYGNCRDMMLAIYNGLNPLESCKYYLLKENERHLHEVEDLALEIEEQRDEIAAWNEVLEQTVAARTTSLRNLLNNAGQGFLSFGPDLIVREEYSSECVRIFGGQITGLKFYDLIFPKDREQRDFVESLFSEIFSNRDQNVREVYLPLLPADFLIKSKHINVEYKLIEDSGLEGAEVCMVILSDVTENRILESQVEQERNLLTMVVKVIVNRTDFIQNIKDFRRFCTSGLPSILAEPTTIEEKLAAVFRHVHTFKGNFSQLNMGAIVERLHQLETEMTNLKNERGLDVDQQELKKLFSELEPDTWLQEDLAYLEQVLGPKLFTQDDELVISKVKLMEIEKRIETLLPPSECKLLIPELRRLRYKPLAELFNSFPDYVNRLAERFEKLVYPVTVTAELIQIDPDAYKGVIKVLVHVFRNAVDHGLEDADERIQQGKEEYGQISITISRNERYIIVEISDDGRGIDATAVRTKALAQGLLPEEQLQAASDEEIIQLIFVDGFSTKETVTDVSGRGIGLAALKHELTRLGGYPRVETVLGQGTTFYLYLPLENEEVWTLPVNDLLVPLLETAQHFLAEQIGLETEPADETAIIRQNSLELNRKTALLAIRGAIECYFVLSVDDEVLRLMVRNYLMDDLQPGEEEEYMQDILGESANTILGNSVKYFPGLEELLIIDSPVALASEEALMRYKQAQIWSCQLQTSAGRFSLGLVVPECTAGGRLVE